MKIFNCFRPVNVLIGEWYRLSFKRSLKDKHVHIPHILVINVQKSALNVPKTQIIDNEICVTVFENKMLKFFFYKKSI